MRFEEIAAPPIELRAGEQLAAGLLWSADADRLLVPTSADRYLQIRGGPGWRPAGSVPRPAGFGLVDLSPDGSRLAWVDRERVWCSGVYSPEAAAAARLPGEPAPSVALRFGPLGRTLLCVRERRDGTCTILRLDAASMELRASWDLGGASRCRGKILDFGPRTGLVAEVSCGQDGTWLTSFLPDGDSLRPHAAVEPDEPCGVVGLAGDGKLVTVTQGAWQVRRWPDLGFEAEVPFPEGFLGEWAGAVSEGRVLLRGSVDADEYYPAFLRLDPALREVVETVPLGGETRVEIDAFRWLDDGQVAAVTRVAPAGRRRLKIYRLTS